MNPKLIRGRVVTLDGTPVSYPKIVLSSKKDKKEKQRHYGDERGYFEIELPEAGDWMMQAHALGVCSEDTPATRDCCEATLILDVAKGTESVSIYRAQECGDENPCESPMAGTNYRMHAKLNPLVASAAFSAPPPLTVSAYAPWSASVSSSVPGVFPVSLRIAGVPWSNGLTPQAFLTKSFAFGPGVRNAPAAVALQRSSVRPVAEQDMWTLIRANTRATAFANYSLFIDRVLGQGQPIPAGTYPTAGRDGRQFAREQLELTSNYGVGAYELLRTGTELFLLLNCRVRTSRNLTSAELTEEIARRGGSAPGALAALAANLLGQNAYIQRVIDAAFPGEPIDGMFADGVLTNRAQEPCLLELIWSYWHEEGMLVQSVNALSRRFQNASGPGRDPLGHFELDPLRPLNNILWGYVQEEYRRLTVPRRNLEYGHHYGMQLIGRAAGGARQADPRSKFLESFHNLLHRCSQFFKEDNDTTVIADGFPLLNALKEVHLILAQGAHNQFGDLPWTARVEMLMQQWIMARTETRDFLQSRAMVPYTEAWMPQVDTMKTVQGWTDVGVSHFRDLGTYGEQLLLSIRYGNWIDVNDEDVAKSWARYWRPEVQSYLHSYRAVTGVDLANPDTVDFTVPSVLLKRRLDSQVRTSR